MPTLAEDLERIEMELTKIHRECDTPAIKASLERLDEAIATANKAFSGSWLGYHSRVYYENLQSPPAGADFSPQWGLSAPDFISHTRGNWVEVDGEKLYEGLMGHAGKPSLDDLHQLCHSVVRRSGELKEELLSVVDACSARADDAYFQKAKKDIEAAKLLSAQDWIEYFQPKGQFMSNDMAAITKGQEIPPHFRVHAEANSVKSGFTMPLTLSKIAKRIALHLSKKLQAKGIAGTQGTKVFIGHGGSAAWRELKDFIEERLGLEADEFNRKPIAGITNITRLSEMLEDAAIAFLVMTGEDETKDGKLHARMNVVHEAGLFQGKLGFARAIVVLEEGCEEFSNIQGLGQIRFPSNKIKSAFEEVRQVLEREGLCRGV